MAIDFDVKALDCSYGWRLGAYKPYNADKPFVTVSCDRHGGVSIVADSYYFYSDELPVVLAMVDQVRALCEKAVSDNKEIYDQERAKEIQVREWPDDADQGKKLLRDGFAFQGICSFKGLTERLKAEFGPCDVWYTERNGDSIGMVCPEGTPLEKLPSSAMDYIAFEWIKPEDDLGGGVVPAIHKRVRA